MIPVRACVWTQKTSSIFMCRSTKSICTQVYQENLKDAFRICAATVVVVVAPFKYLLAIVSDRPTKMFTCLDFYQPLNVNVPEILALLVFLEIYSILIDWIKTNKHKVEKLSACFELTSHTYSDNGIFFLPVRVCLFSAEWRYFESLFIEKNNKIKLKSNRVSLMSKIKQIEVGVGRQTKYFCSHLRWVTAISNAYF